MSHCALRLEIRFCRPHATSASLGQCTKRTDEQPDKPWEEWEDVWSVPEPQLPKVKQARVRYASAMVFFFGRQALPPQIRAVLP